MKPLRFLAHPGTLTGLGIVGLLLLDLVPSLDLEVSGLFYRASAGFFLSRWLPFRLLYESVPVLAWSFALVLILGLLLAALSRPFRWGTRERAMLFLLLSLIVGPGLLANTVLKDHWGRARPSQTEEFGGDRRFTPVLEPSDQCGRNCSFPAGHAAMAFYPLSLLFLTRRRRPALTLGFVGFGLLIGTVRIAQGGHFLSDVIAAGLLVAATAWALNRCINRTVGRSSGGDLAGAAREVYRAIGRVLTRPGRLSPTQGAGVLAGLFLLVLAATFMFVDRALAIRMHALDPQIVALFEGITQLGVGTGWLVGSGGLWLLLWIMSWQSGLLWLRTTIRRGRDAAAFFFLAVVVSGLVTDLLKVILGRARPRLYFTDHLYGFTWFAGQAAAWSMPSGHTTTIAAVATALAVLWPRHVAAYALIALLVAISRIAVGAHYLSDVMLGAAIGSGITLLLSRAAAARGLVLRLQR